MTIGIWKMAFPPDKHIKTASMTLITSFLRLIRWPNLFFIALTQFLFYNHIVKVGFSKDVARIIPQQYLWLLIVASVFIAAAGYIINDYFDMQIDNVNKPDKVVVDTIIKRRWAIMWHWIFSLSGIVLTVLVCAHNSQWQLLYGNLLCVAALWFYSTHFKKRLLVGNVMISLLTAWTIFSVYLFSGSSLFNISGWDAALATTELKWLYKLTMMYAGFAFIITLIREVVKDLEDMQGDAGFGCSTMPIQWGVPASKVFVAVWIVVCAGALSVIQLYAWQNGYLASSVYILLLVIIPLLLLIRKLKKAVLPADYHKISSMLKLIMLAGILSMLFF